MIARFIACLVLVCLWMSASAQQFGPSQQKLQQPGDADATLLNTSTTVITGALTATRTWTLPAASSMVPGSTIRVTDVSGVISSPGNNIIIKANGSDTINGRATYTINRAYGTALLMSNGNTKWAVAGQSADVPNAEGLVSMNPYGVVQGPLTLMKLYPLPGSVQGSGATAPGAGLATLYITKGSTFGTCRLVILGGTSTTTTQIGSDFGGGC